MSTMLLAIILFLVTYLCLLVFTKQRAYIATVSAALFVILGVLPAGKALGSIDWNVLMMIAGLMGTAVLFTDSRMPAKLADIVIEKAPNVKWAIIALTLLAGLISAFVDNVATVLMIAPVAVGIFKKLKISPVGGIIAISVASNLQGAATLVGDTTSILLGGAAGLNFNDFFVLQGKMGMFFIVQISALAATAVLFFLCRHENKPASLEKHEVVKDYFPSYMLLGTFVLLIIASFVPAAYKPGFTNGLICMAVYIAGILRFIIVKKDAGEFLRTLKGIDALTLLFLAGLFIVIAGVKEAGVVGEVAKLVVSVSGGNLFLLYTIIVWSSVLLSAVIDNLPYIAALLPVIAGVAVQPVFAEMGVSPYLLYFGLLSGATLGGNLTRIGASANIAGLAILRREGYEVGPGQFMRISVPYTLAAVVVGYALIWLVWA